MLPSKLLKISTKIKFNFIKRMKINCGTFNNEFNVVIIAQIIKYIEKLQEMINILK